MNVKGKIHKKREELIEKAKKYTWFNNGREQFVYEKPGKFLDSQSGSYFIDILGMREVLEIVEKVASRHAKGKVVMPPKLYLDLPDY
jgi:hypothetical protein